MTHSEAEETAAPEPVRIWAGQLQIGDVVEGEIGFQVLELLGTDPENGDPMADAQRHIHVKTNAGDSVSFLLDYPLEVIREQ